MMVNNSRERTLRAYQAYSFALYDILLYLDAYPDNREAIESYNKYHRLASKAKAEYESKFGPISMPFDVSTWEWANGPWPWQVEGGK